MTKANIPIAKNRPRKHRFRDKRIEAAQQAERQESYERLRHTIRTKDQFSADELARLTTKLRGWVQNQIGNWKTRLAPTE